jgi:uncharacterized protein HemX|tara:strand:- start:465 stop:785 length:321 start_codon:yes stop_codon:yes gene_type:complete
MQDFVSLYAEYGALALVVGAFFYGYFKQSQRADEQASSLLDLRTENRGQSETLENTESMLIKLIDRWNKSDERLDRKFDDLTKEINDLDNQVSEIKGVISRLNGKS